MHRKTSTLDEKLTYLDRQAKAALARVARAIGAQFRALRHLPLPRFRPSRARHAQPQPVISLPLPSRGAVTAALVTCGFLASATALVGATAAAPGTRADVSTAADASGSTGSGAAADAGADADRRAAAERADRADRAPADPAATPSAPAPAAVVRIRDWYSPMPGTPLSSCYGWRWGALHQGIDFAGAAGTPIRAAGAGTVFGAGWLYSGYGISVVIDHGNGLFTHYAHLSRVLVAEGQRVNANDVIGLEGSTGDSTGPHLHFEVHQGLWNQVDPAAWLRGRGVPAAC
jgi:murein DD-endopeptidase MepM/ murein hydrolase activator NlpD